MDDFPCDCEPLPSEAWDEPTRERRQSPHCGIPYGFFRGFWNLLHRDSGNEAWVVTGCCSECGVWITLTPPVLP